MYMVSICTTVNRGDNMKAGDEKDMIEGIIF